MEKAMARRLSILVTAMVMTMPVREVNGFVDRQQVQQSSFCERALASVSCANPPTVNGDFNVEEYLGRWYEIGCTASFKLLTEAGLICDQAVYSSSADGNLSLLNSGLRVIGLLAVAEVVGIDLAAGSACSAARDVCYQLPALADISQSLSNRSLASRLNSSVQSAELALQSLSDDVSLVQQTNGQISQANYTGDRTLNSSVEGIKLNVEEAEVEQQAILKFATELSDIIGEVKEENTTAAEVLVTTSLKVAESVAAIAVSLKAVELASEVLLTNGQPIEDASVSSVTGTITQPDAAAAAKLEVTIIGNEAPYWVIDLERSDDGSYSAALVYSCTEGTGKSLFVLSREPTLAQATLDGFLAKAESLGIYNDCEDPFLFTLQKGGDCGQAVSKPSVSSMFQQIKR
ncbi:hypothetical protein KP509_39G013900 [Ceratopteris richardii]|uniref:Lipocalin/cytosolic fatty-acid binding domain-containing protein n=1 Tax=Ceratopteris richardii TaxID=49495 RepID=A0A8T2PZC0_CERRI|nr:hypothetical protein KP509_39G013900 [Ceratopteris richardii]